MEPEKPPIEEKKAEKVEIEKNLNEPSPPKRPFLDYFTGSTRDMIAYVLLIFGVILLFFHPFYGSFLIGIVAGAYFSKEIHNLLNNYQKYIDQQGLVRSLILGGTALAFLILAPGLFIGTILMLVLKLFVFSEDKPES